MGTVFGTRVDAVAVLVVIGGSFGVVGAVEGVEAGEGAEGVVGDVERLLKTASSISTSLKGLGVLRSSSRGRQPCLVSPDVSAK